jgi:hypothetical protein
MGANISHQAYQRKTLMFTSSPKRPLRDEEFHPLYRVAYGDAAFHRRRSIS